MKQISMFDGSQPLIVTKPIRLIELFAGYGSQSLALDYLGIPHESWRISEWAIPSIRAYKDLHHDEDNINYSATVTDEDIAKWLSGRISSNYNNPLSDEQIKRLGAKRRAEIYNAMMASHNLGSIVAIHGDDLNIVDTDRYTYLMFYSFPCQDLSVAGNGAGCAKGSGTRSGLLWEVERILDELNGGGQHYLPQVLIAENVPALLAEKNRPDFYEWLRKLESLGYHNYYQTLNAKNFGIPQNRERVFVVSILGDYFYDFPKTIPLEHRLKDLLQKTVQDNYYLRDEQVRMFTEHCERKQAEGCGFAFAPTDGGGVR